MSKNKPNSTYVADDFPASDWTREIVDLVDANVDDGVFLRGLPRFSRTGIRSYRLRKNMEDNPEVFFSEFIRDNILNKFVNAASSYATSSGRSKWKTLALAELKLYFGLVLYMGVVPLPSQHDYRSETMGQPYVSSKMNYIHFCDMRLCLIL